MRPLEEKNVFFSHFRPTSNAVLVGVRRKTGGLLRYDVENGSLLFTLTPQKWREPIVIHTNFLRVFSRKSRQNGDGFSRRYAETVGPFSKTGVTFLEKSASFFAPSTENTCKKLV